MRDIGASGNSEFTPSTFAERGLFVPFTSPLLAQARIRLDRNEQFEFILPNLASAKGSYIMSWKAIPSVTSVTLHDRLLFDAIAALDVHSPESIRTAALEVQRSGLCGPDAAFAAERALSSDAQYMVLTQFMLMLEVIKLAGHVTAELMRPGLTLAESQRAARSALADAAKTIGVPAAGLWDTLEQIGREAAAVGLPRCPQAGRLRAMSRRLAAFAAEMQAFHEEDPSDAAELAGFVAQVARFTIELVGVRMAQVDKLLVSPKALVKVGTESRTAIRMTVARVSWLLDGWEFILSLWDSVRDGSPCAQRDAVTEIFRLVPVIPKEEIMMSAVSFGMESLGPIQRRWVKLNEDWRTGAVSMLSVAHVEALKARVA
ncbi:MAG: hypothetical protein RLY86_4161 [Pseudomonadota bacterium]|jgi:hypothetical protein